jgi:hypothetical protein
MLYKYANILFNCCCGKKDINIYHAKVVRICSYEKGLKNEALYFLYEMQEKILVWNK